MQNLALNYRKQLVILILPCDRLNSDDAAAIWLCHSKVFVFPSFPNFRMFVPAEIFVLLALIPFEFMQDLHIVENYLTIYYYYCRPTVVSFIIHVGLYVFTPRSWRSCVDVSCQSIFTSTISVIGDINCSSHGKQHTLIINF